ncbi:MAG: rsmD [Mucilaginibacter sp.]|nr:rsmD [Mucilaginibacter sp.]
MRIIGGALRGLRLNPPKNLPVRPTTDLAKEALFNILQNKIAFENIRVLDLFSGTGNISLEFASRGAEIVVSVDRSIQCVNYLKDTARQHKLNNIKTYKDDVFKYLQLETEQYDLVFADPPYDLNRIPEIPRIIFDKNLLLPDGLLIVEHQSLQNLSKHPLFIEQREYGHSSFSFFGTGNQNPQ